MKIIIAGGREFTNYNLLKVKCDKILSNINEEIIIVSGNARGADHLGEKYAKERNYKLKLFPADWKKFGLKGGYLRNMDMAEYADALICFWDGKSKGSGHMINIAKEKGLKVRIIKY